MHVLSYRGAAGHEFTSPSGHGMRDVRDLRELELGDIVLGDLQYESEMSEMDSEGPITIDMTGHESEPMVVTYRLTGKLSCPKKVSARLLSPF